MAKDRSQSKGPRYVNVFGRDGWHLIRTTNIKRIYKVKPGEIAIESSDWEPPMKIFGTMDEWSSLIKAQTVGETQRPKSVVDEESSSAHTLISDYLKRASDSVENNKSNAKRKLTETNRIRCCENYVVKPHDSCPQCRKKILWMTGGGIFV